MKLLARLTGRFTIDHAIKSIRDSIARLEDLIEHHNAEANKHASTILEAEVNLDEAKKNSERASRISDKLKELVQ